MSTYVLNIAYLEDKLVHTLRPAHIPYVILPRPSLIMNQSRYIFMVSLTIWSYIVLYKVFHYGSHFLPKRSNQLFGHYITITSLSGEKIHQQQNVITMRNSK